MAEQNQIGDPPITTLYAAVPKGQTFAEHVATRGFISLLPESAITGIFDRPHLGVRIVAVTVHLDEKLDDPMRALVLVDARGRWWHLACAGRILGQHTRHDECRGEEHRYVWDTPTEPANLDMKDLASWKKPCSPTVPEPVHQDKVMTYRDAKKLKVNDKVLHRDRTVYHVKEVHDAGTTVWMALQDIVSLRVRLANHHAVKAVNP